MRATALGAVRGRRRAALTLALPVALSSLLLAQPQQPIRVGANFVRVDVYPTRDGRVVDGLVAPDFEVFEDGVLQKVEAFEHVVVRPAGSQNDRIEVSSQRESLQAAANPRNRVFVIFLDTPHVMVSSAHAINEPLIRFMDRILGPDDLVGVMTPAMAASQVVLGRKTQVIEESLRKNWPWGTRFSLLRAENELAHAACPGWTEELLARKRERATLEALEDLVRYLRTIRDERKAILTVTEGWLLYGPKPSLMEPQSKHEPPPRVDPVVVGPDGTLTTRDPRRIAEGALTRNECDTDRMRLAMLDNKQFFRDVMDQANSANASFYPVDPRGLPAFDTPIGPAPPPPITVDLDMLRHRIEVLKTLAGNTDGIAATDNNDLDRGMKRISDDLTSYYLLGYYSTNAKLDGGFRSLRVRVKQPGIDVRARRGYRAARAEEVNTLRRAAEAPVPEATRAIDAALDRLGRARPDARFSVNAIATAGGNPVLWIAGELQVAAGRPDDFGKGGTADIEATAGSMSTSTRVTLKPGERTFLASLPLPAGATGEISVRARVSAADGGAMPISDSLRIDSASFGLQPLLFRRGVTTGNRVLPAADMRFSRTERVRLELPVSGDAKPGAGRLLDRTGQPMQVPVVVAERLDPVTGQRWVTADLALAALAGGDYAVEIGVADGGKTRTIISAIRVVR